MKKINPIITAILLISASLSAFAAPFTQEQEQRIRELIRETLIQQPQILEESISELQKQEYNRQDAEMEKRLRDSATQLYNNPISPKIGPEKAALTLVYFTDYNCPYCKQFEASLDKLMAKYSDVNVIIKPLPYLGDSSRSAAETALTLWQTQPKKFASVHRDLMAQTGRHDRESIQKILAKHNLTELSTTQQAKISLGDNTDLAEALDIGGTPVTVIGNTMLMGAVPYEDLEAAVIQALEKQRN